MPTGELPYPDAEALSSHWWWRPNWRPGTRWYSWHITLEDQPELHRLAAAYQAALSQFPQLDLIPQRWLHITVQGIGNSEDVSDDDRDAIAKAVRARLEQLDVPPLTFGRPVLHREAVVMPPTNPEPLRHVRATIRAGIADVWGLDHVPEDADGYRPHFSLAYVNSGTAPGPARAALDAVNVEPTAAHLALPTLILLNRDHLMYKWEFV